MHHLAERFEVDVDGQELAHAVAGCRHTERKMEAIQMGSCRSQRARPTVLQKRINGRHVACDAVGVKVLILRDLPGIELLVFRRLRGTCRKLSTVRFDEESRIAAITNSRFHVYSGK